MNRFIANNKTWYKLKKFSQTYGDIKTVRTDSPGYLRAYLTNDLKFSPKMIELLMKNSSETNWPAGFKTAQLREQNKEMMKQLKGQSNCLIKVILYFFYFLIKFKRR